MWLWFAPGQTKQHDRDDVCCGDAEGDDGDDDGVGIITMADGDRNDVAE